MIQDAFQEAVSNLLLSGSQSLSILFQNLVQQQQQFAVVLQAGFTEFLSVILGALDGFLPPYM
jgi:hypothetical protein